MKDNELETIRQRKRGRFAAPAAPRQTFIPLLVIALLAIAALVVTLIAVRGNKQTDQPVNAGQAQAAAQDGLLHFPISTVGDGLAHYYIHEAEGKTIQFFLLKSSDGVIRAAFNACDVCYPARKGYRQEGDQMVCNNCGLRFPSVRINEVQGGCNPAPLERTIEGDQVIIRVEDLLAGARYF